MDLEDAKYIYTIVGQNLKRLRLEKKMTQEEFAHKSTYSLGFIMNLESSSYSQSISLGTVWHFAKVLDVDIKEFFRPLD